MKTSRGKGIPGKTDGSGGVCGGARFRVMALAAPLVCLAAICMSSCAVDYVTGRRTFSLISESQEIEMGAKADPEIVAQYGLYDDPELARYVDAIGQRAAKVSQRPNLKYTYRVIDSPIINAFALPGGYVYVTRGILAHFNSEDELAGVIGHETGHVVARHSAEQISRQQLADLGLGLGSLLSDRFRRFADLASASVGLLFLSFSRGQESEADLLGVEYSTRLGYDAHHMANFFQTLKRESEESGQALPSFLSTHPDPGDREVRVHRLADEWQGKVPYEPLNRDRLDYLRRIDGIVYGDDPRQGFVEDHVFYHPQLRFRFPVPSGWQVNNTPRVVQMVSSDGSAAIQFGLGKGASPQEEARSFVARYGVSVLRTERTSVHGFPAYVLESTLESDGSTLQVMSYFLEKDRSVYVFHGFTTVDHYGRYAGTFAAVMTGFDELRDPDKLHRKPKRLRIEAAPRSGDLAAVLAALGMQEDTLEELARLNGRRLEDRIEKGEPLKVVRE